MGTVDRLQAGVDCTQVNESPQRQMGQDAVQVGLGLHRSRRRHRRTLPGAMRGMMRWAAATSPRRPESDQRLCLDSRRFILQLLQ